MKLLIPFIEFDMLAFRVLSKKIEHLTKSIIRGTDFTQKKLLLEKTSQLPKGNLMALIVMKIHGKTKSTNSRIEEISYPGQ